ncbi:hypothetical protein [Planctomicrobium piriforme]|nr:hypothetical protein [Planctomicrobium piriforme]
MERLLVEFAKANEMNRFSLVPICLQFILLGLLEFGLFLDSRGQMHSPRPILIFTFVVLLNALALVILPVVQMAICLSREVNYKTATICVSMTLSLVMLFEFARACQ